MSTRAARTGTTSRRRRRSRSASVRKREGIALIIAMIAVSVLGVMLADLHESTTTAFVVANSDRDALKAEYLARSGLDLTRMLVMREPQIRMTVAPLFQLLAGRAPPQLPIWKYSDMLLGPFCDYEHSREDLLSAGVDVTSLQGLGETGGTCSTIGVAENSKTNVNDPLSLSGDDARKSVAMQLFATMGGYQAPSPFDPLFERADAEGQYNTRLDILSSMIDWWDADQDRTVFDPGANAVSSSGTEDDVYRRYRDPYVIKNAPFDSLEEVHLIRGVSDDFWATFVASKPDDPAAERFTVYGSGAVNPNEAPAEVLLARLCSYVPDQSLCTDMIEASKFIQLLRTVRGILPIPFFTRSGDFLNFVEGKGGPTDLYPLLSGMLGNGPMGSLLFRPVTIPAGVRVALDNAFVTAARIITIQTTGRVGRTRVRVRAVVNFHDRWTPPPPNAGVMPALGVFQYYRVD